jgi:uncharacterized membrane protein
MSEIPMRKMALLLFIFAFFAILTLLVIHPVSIIEIENATETEMQEYAEKLIFATNLLALMTVLICILVIVYDIKKRRTKNDSLR